MKLDATAARVPRPASRGPRSEMGPTEVSRTSRRHYTLKINNLAVTKPRTVRVKRV